MYPEVYRRFLSGIDVLNFDLGWILSAECIIDFNFHHRLIISAIGPPVALAILGGSYAMATRKPCAIHEGVLVTANEDARHRYLPLVLLLTFLVNSLVSSTLC